MSEAWKPATNPETLLQLAAIYVQRDGIAGLKKLRDEIAAIAALKDNVTAQIAARKQHQRENELRAAAENFVRVKGRHHTEQAYKRLEAAVTAMQEQN